MLCKCRLLLWRKHSTSSRLEMADRLCCTTGGEGEVGGSSRIHLGKAERGRLQRGRERK